MKLGQTTIVHFISKFVAVVVGFFGTVYFARTVGAETLGTYFLVLGLLTLMKKFGNIGVRTAMTKRLSENQDAAYITAGFIVQSGFYVAMAACLVLLHNFVNQYVGADITAVLVVLLFVRVCLSLLHGVFDGEHSVHTSSILEALETILRTGIQVVGILLGFKLGALLFGYFAGIVVVIGVALYFVSTRVKRPTREHVKSITSYVKYSWLGGVRSVSFAWMDTLILGFFVSNTLIGVYEVAWMASSILAIFGTSISRAVFPQISTEAAGGATSDISDTISKSIGYAGCLLIPGIIGSVFLGEALLLVYGEKFVMGYTVLIILMIARLLYAYQQQYLTTLNAIDRPDLSFHISAVFSVSNIALNCVLIYLIGWVGAAIATAVSCGTGLAISMYYLTSLVDMRFPFRFVGKQWFAGGIMGVCVALGTRILSDTLPIAILLVGIGAAIYFGILSMISRNFRSAIYDNILFI